MASVQYVVNATDAASAVFAKIALSADGLDKQLEELGRRVADPEVNLEDSKFTLGMIKAAERLDKLSAQVADPSVEVDTAKAQTEILRINAMLDRLDAKRVSVTVDVDQKRGIFSRLLGSGGEGGGGLRGLLAGGPQGLGTGLAGLGGAGPYALGGLAALIATLVPATLPAALGLGAGGIAAGGAFAIGKKENEELQKLNKAAMTATGKKKRLLEQQIKQVQKSGGPELAIYGAFQDVGMGLLGSFTSALEAKGPGFSAGPHGQAGAPSFLTGLLGILKQIGGFVKTLAPLLGGLFRASIPYLKMFVGFLEQSAKVLLPTFVQMLQEMRPFLPLISKGLLNIVQGFAGFLNAIGPSGMQASAKIFVVVTKGMAGILVAFGHTINWLTEHIPTWAHNIAAWWDRLRHWTDVIFTTMRHDIAAIWDAIFNNTVGRTIRGAHDIEREFGTWRHNIADVFDAIRHSAATVWDAIWNNTVGRTQRGIDAVVGWFKRMPGNIIRALWGLGHTLGSFASAALSEMWNGFKRIGSGIVGWIKNFAGGIVSIFKKIWGIFSPSSVFADIGKNMMLGLEKGIKAHAHKAQDAVSGSVKFNVGAGVRQWAPLVRQALAMEGLSPMLAGRVLFQMQTESGGNPNVTNNWDSNAAAGDPSRGLMQVIGSTFAAYHWPGTSWNIFNPLANIAAAINYARHRYGPTLMSGGMGIGSGHGYAYGTNSAYPGWAWVGERGPELVRFRGGESVKPGAAGNTYNITVNVPPSANKADIGRVTVECIREYERRSGPGWRK